MISFEIDWFDLLAVQGTLKSLLQHHILKASILQCSATFMVQLSHPCMTTGNITIEKHPHMGGPVQFKRALFMSQLYLEWK